MSQKPSKPIQVLVVDDSAIIRQILRDILSADERIEVVGIAKDGIDALEKIAKLKPDVVTLDINMPRMDGLTALEKILEIPLPTVMVSALTQQDAFVTFRALEMGAVDFIAKPDQVLSSRDDFGPTLIKKVCTAANTDMARLLKKRATAKLTGSTEAKQHTSSTKLPPAENPYHDCCIAIGISTGGPPALSSLMERIRLPMPPIVIVQHMPANFTTPFANRLDSVSRLTVKEAETGDCLKPDHVLLAPGGKHLKLERRGSKVFARVFDGEPVASHKPSVDVLMNSVATAFQERSLGVIMTGMGFDGVDGCLAIRKQGGFVLGQDQDSSDVYGMNKAAFTAGGVDQQFSLTDLPALLTRKSRKQFAVQPALAAVQGT